MGSTAIDWITNEVAGSCYLGGEGSQLVDLLLVGCQVPIEGAHWTTHNDAKPRKTTDTWYPILSLPLLLAANAVLRETPDNTKAVNTKAVNLLGLLCLRRAPRGVVINSRSLQDNTRMIRVVDKCVSFREGFAVTLLAWSAIVR